MRKRGLSITKSFGVDITSVEIMMIFPRLLLTRVLTRLQTRVLNLSPVWLSVLLLASLAEPSLADKDLVPTPKATKLPPNLYEYRLPPPAPEPVAQIEAAPEPVKEVTPPPIQYMNPEPALRAARVKRLMLKRRTLQTSFAAEKRERTTTSIEEALYARDPHYRQWDQRTLEDKFTYPVDRSWILTADRYISGVLETEINSQIPGTVILVVDRPIFAAEGWKVIFPQYTKVVCEYQSLNKVSDSRLSLKCIRAIRPDGASLLFTEAHGTDPMGRNGLVGEIDYRTAERYGTAFIMAGISALAGAGTNASSNPVLQQGAANLSQNLGQITTKVIDQYIDLAPIITIEAGTRVHIRPQTDVWLREPMTTSEVATLQKQQQDLHQGEKHS